MKLTTRKITYMALFAALCYVGTLLNIPISVGGMKTMIHFGNIFCLIGAAVLGPVLGGIAASVGMGLFDLTNGWAVYAPSTFILKFFIAYIAGSIYNKSNKSVKATATAFAFGMLFNVVASPLVIYVLARLLGFGEISNIVAAWESIASLVNALLSVVIATLIYRKLMATEIFKNINLN